MCFPSVVAYRLFHSSQELWNLGCRVQPRSHIAYLLQCHSINPAKSCAIWAAGRSIVHIRNRLSLIAMCHSIHPAKSCTIMVRIRNRLSLSCYNVTVQISPRSVLCCQCAAALSASQFESRARCLSRGQQPRSYPQHISKQFHVSQHQSRQELCQLANGPQHGSHSESGIAYLLQCRSTTLARSCAIRIKFRLSMHAPRAHVSTIPFHRTRPLHF
jgi:hypothetical protein